jgi:hypothetical protein
MLMGRAQQSLNIDPNDPIIKGQTAAYNANEERARRDYISDAAESGGPLVNLQGEKRIAAERLGQKTGAFQAELIGRELTARRAEIQAALQQMGDMLTEEQRLSLQRELGLLDNQIRGRELDIRHDLGGRDLDLRQLLGLRALDDENDQFALRLGFDTADRNAYWDDRRRNGGL